MSSNDNNNISAAAAALGRKGGSVKSEAKAASSAANGKKGGRPMKLDNQQLGCLSIQIRKTWGPDANFSDVTQETADFIVRQEYASDAKASRDENSILIWKSKSEGQEIGWWLPNGPDEED